MPVLPLNAVIGSYRIEEMVGSGGMGEVYRAVNLKTRASVAVKALTQIGGADAALARFRNEAVIQYSLRHPHVAELYEYFEYQGRACIVMEFVEGRTLKEWIRETGPLNLTTALEILADICDAVSYMHSKGTIHRDIKSENIRIDPRGKAKLLDFGISVSKETPSFTKTGYSIGTPEKMAPEQHLGLRGDARSDVWALGILLYEMTTGSEPFSNSDLAGLREDIVGLRYVTASKRRAAIPKPVGRMIATCLRVKPDDRYASSGVMLREVQKLRRSMGGPTVYGRMAHPAVLAGGIALLGIVLAVFALSQHPKPDPPRIAVPGTSTPVFETGIHSNVGTSAPEPSRSQPPPKAAPAPPAADTPRTLAPVVVVPAAALVADNTDAKTVRVATYDGPADVLNKDGQIIGSTPYLLTGRRGASYELWLSRPGFQSRKVDVEINNKNEYLFGLEKKD
jgi:serine/threonine-protein kinase